MNRPFYCEESGLSKDVLLQSIHMIGFFLSFDFVSCAFMCAPVLSTSMSAQRCIISIAQKNIYHCSGLYYLANPTFKSIVSSKKRAKERRALAPKQ